MSLLLARLGGDTLAPISVFVSQTATTISRVSGKSSLDVTFSGNEAWQAYQIRRVSSPSDPISAGTLVETGTGLNIPQDQNYVTTITDPELEAASGSEGTNMLKIFLQDIAGNWST